jgi:hypothetical protein
MPITLAAAAKLCGLDKSTLRKAVRTGKISGTRDVHGVWQVEIAEVERVYPLAPTDGAGAIPRSSTGQGSADTATDVLVLELRRVIEDLRSDRDHWRDQAERLALPKPEPKQSLWRWLRTAG